MIFASISYSNLLPFQIFIKKNISNTQIKQIAFYKKNVPSYINKKFLEKKVDAAFISSIKSQKAKCSNIGIIAHKKVYSVFVLKKREHKEDKESNSSNILAQILNVHGEVIIGDKALKYYLKNKDEKLLDLAELWYEKTNLPFVFARLCFNKYNTTIQKLANKFTKTKVKVPYFYLKKEAKKRGLSPKELQWYLNHIYYKIGHKEKRALKLFFKYARKIN